MFSFLEIRLLSSSLFLSFSISSLNTIFCPRFESYFTTPFSPYFCNFTASAGHLVIGGCDCDGSQVLHLYSDSHELLVQSAGGCAFGGAMIFHDVEEYSSFSLQGECYDGPCDCSVPITGTNVIFTTPSVPIENSCPTFFGLQDDLDVGHCNFMPVKEAWKSTTATRRYAMECVIFGWMIAMGMK